jgi:hypothetical protein
MKKIIASALGFVMFCGIAVTTLSAVENKFGGYWRVRAFTQNEMQQDGSHTRVHPIRAHSLVFFIQTSYCQS